MKLIHCADLHIGSALESIFSQELASERKSELLRTFKRTVDRAAELNAKAIMICGDLFDTANAPKKAGRYILGVIEEHPEIDFLYVSGNHDPGDLLDQLCIEDKDKRPENLIIFPNDRWETVRYDNLTVTGISLTCDSVPPLPPLAPADINIVMLHGDIYKLGTKQFENRNIDYLALGHFHSYEAKKLDKRGVYCYCGCLEGRGFDECGEKGFVLLNTEGSALSYDFVRSGARTVRRVECDITGLVTLKEIEDSVDRAVSGIGKGDIIRLILIGQYTVDTEKDLRHIEGMLSDRFYFARVKDESTLEINPDEYKNDISLKGEFIRLAMSDSSLSKEQSDRIITLGVRALRNEEL